MSFHSPIGDAQWNRAKFSYARMRSHLKSLEKDRPPQTPDEMSILRSYKVYVRAFGIELHKPLKTIDAERSGQPSRHRLCSLYGHLESSEMRFAMLEMSLTTECCKQIVEDILKKPSWSLPRMARTIGLPEGHVRMVQSGLQSFQVADVEALAKACGTKAYELVLNTFKDELAKKDPAFYELAMKQLDLHREMEKILSAKPARKSRSRSTAAAAKTSPKPAARRRFART